VNLNNYHNVYFIGIGGIGMSAIARWFNLEGRFVAGYDKTSTPLTNSLQKEGIEVHFDDDVEFIPEKIKKEKEHTLVVYTPAVPKHHKEYNYLLDQGYLVQKRSQVLGLIAREQFTIAVAGTHGKTTTSSMIAHILHEAGLNSVGFLGGVLQNYDSNLVIRGKGEPDTKVVVEADEFDRSFLTLNPDYAVITSADADHLDIYGSHKELIQSFGEFIKKIKAGGKLFINSRIADDFSCPESVRKFTYSMEKGDFYSDKIQPGPGFFTFDYVSSSIRITDLQLNVPGFHNVENVVAAISVSLALGIDEKSIRKAVSSYRGVKRRFDYKIKSDKLVYIDDYAHHPTEINALLDSVRALYPNKKMTVVFQPHLYSRTRDFAEGFSESLSKADELVMLNIYPARELPIEGVDSNMILRKATCKEKYLIEDDDLMEWLSKRDLEVLLTVGAGDIDRFVEPIREMLKKGESYA